MLFMIIEDMSRDGLDAIRDRFRERGRMLPEGVEYLSSWIEESGRRCFQLMETENVEMLDDWIAAWDDIVDFEVAPVMTSTDFWQARANP